MIKKIRMLIVGLFLLFISNTAFAYNWWTANANVNVFPLEVNASVYNGLNKNIYCLGRVVGTTYYGTTLWSQMDVVISPGYDAYVYVYTNRNNPFIYGDANIQCRTY